jgi:hypothetical protein
MSSFFLLLIAILPRLDGPVADRVDLVEVNRHHDENCRLIFTQCIFLDWDGRAGRYRTRAWRMVKSDNQMPKRDWDSGGYVMLWFDGQVLRQVRASEIRETWTQEGLHGDPEVVDRQYFPKESRADLSSPRTK